MNPPRPFESNRSRPFDGGAEDRLSVHRGFDAGPPGGVSEGWRDPSRWGMPWQAEVALRAAALDPTREGLAAIAGAMPVPVAYTRPPLLTAGQKWWWRGLGAALGIGVCAYVATKGGKS